MTSLTSFKKISKFKITHFLNAKIRSKPEIKTAEMASDITEIWLNLKNSSFEALKTST